MSGWEWAGNDDWAADRARGQRVPPAIIVGVAANTRGRSFAWFFLALLISPILSGLLLLALPRIDRKTATAGRLPWEPHPPAAERTTGTFSADGVYSGPPYRVLHDGSVEAAMPSGLVHFKNMDDFVAAATGKDAR
jgi:hypothetical protein